MNDRLRKLILSLIWSSEEAEYARIFKLPTRSDEEKALSKARADLEREINSMKQDCDEGQG